MKFSDLFGTPQKAVEPAPPVNGIAELEERIDRICRAVGVSPTQVEARASDTSSLPSEIMAEIVAGRKIQAIKLYRDLTNQGLKESKDAIEAAADGVLPGATQYTILQAKLDAILAKVEAER